MLNTELDFINLVLRKLGEPPLSSVDVQYPTLDLVRPALAEARQTLLAEGWWFNTLCAVRLTPSDTGAVVVPADTLAFYPDEPDRYIFTGAAVVHSDGNPIIQETVVGRRVVDLPLLTLPISARYCVAYAAAAQVYAQDVGTDDIYRDISQHFASAYRELSSQHTRTRQHNSRRKLQVQRWRTMLRS